MSVWTISAEEIYRLQGHDPEHTALMNELLAESTAGILAPAALRLNLKTQAPDGGVDAAVDGLVPPERDTMGLFATPTCWQFKASPSDHIKPPKGKKGGQEAALRIEIRKPHVKELIANGYGYRLCITDSLTPEKRNQWEGWLLDEARKINPNALRPIVVEAVLLANWCSRYAGIVRRLRPFLDAVHDFQTWDRIASAQAPTFVASESRQGVTSAIQAFADLSRTVTSPVFTISGEAGIGKTRCVLEALRPLPGITALVVESSAETAAVQVIHYLLNQPTLRAVFVIDGMSTATRTRLAHHLAAVAHRLRVIAIDNERQEDTLPEGEIRLAPVEQQDLERILAANFPDIPNEQRWAIADLSDGFVRLALDVCRNLHLLPPTRDLAALASLVRDDYLVARLSPEQRTVVELVSLLARVGYRGELADELRILCDACPAAGMSPERVVAIARDIQNAPGFIAVGARYLYVTPRVIAQAAFRSAWQRWVQTEPEAFFMMLPVELEDALYRQLRDAGSEAMRRLFTSFHQTWLRGLGPADLSDPGTMYRLIRLAEVEPETVLPHLADLIESATSEQIDSLNRVPLRRNSRGAAWPSRRQLVWLCEAMLRFVEFYAFAERILFRLALNESESYGNNATQIWCNAYRPFLSGTPIPFVERLARLEERLNAATTDTEVQLCFQAFVGPLTADGPGHRMSSPSLISGRLPPPDWFPATHEEARHIWQSTAELLARFAHQAHAVIADGVIDLVIANMFGLIRHGYLCDLIKIIESRPITEARLAALLHEIDRFQELYCNPDRRHASQELDASIRSWRDRLLPTSFRGRLQSTLRRSAFDIYHYNADRGEGLVSGLAQELLNDPAMVSAELPWLFTQEASSAHMLGIHLGRLDSAAELLERLAEAARGQPNISLLGGYVVGLLDRHTEQTHRVCELLDRLTPTQPLLAFQLLTTGFPGLCPIERAFALVDAGQIPAAYLQEVWRLVCNRRLDADELSGVLTRLLAAVQTGDVAAGQGAIDVLSMQIHTTRHGHPEATVFGPDQLPLVQTTLEATLPINLGRQAWAWVELVQELGRYLPEVAIRLAVAGLMSENSIPLSHPIERYLPEAAQQHPQTMMNELGRGLLTPVTGWRIRLHELTPVIAALPFATTRAWVEQHGLDGARAIARLLPAPRLHEGAATVRELTEFVLEHFGEDRRLFGEFCAGVASYGMRSGDIAAQYDQDAVVARAFFTHRCRWIREWAIMAERGARADADWFRADDEAMEAP